MKKTQKVIGASFFSLVAVTFLFSLVCHLIDIESIIILFQDIKNTWSTLVIWLLEVVLAIMMICKSMYALVRLRKNKTKGTAELVKKNGSLLSCFFSYLLIEGVYTLFLTYYLTKEFDVLSNLEAILFLAIEVIATLFALIVSLNGKCKILGCTSYAFLFVMLIIAVTKVKPTGYQLPYTILMFLVSVLGFIQIAASDVSVEKSSKKKKERPAIEENKEEINTEENNSDVNIA